MGFFSSNISWSLNYISIGRFVLLGMPNSSAVYFWPLFGVVHSPSILTEEGVAGRVTLCPRPWFGREYPEPNVSPRGWWGSDLHDMGLDRHSIMLSFWFSGSHQDGHGDLPPHAILAAIFKASPGCCLPLGAVGQEDIGWGLLGEGAHCLICSMLVHFHPNRPGSSWERYFRRRYSSLYR